MHRVINLTSEGTDKTVIAGHKTAIRNMIDAYSANVHTAEVNDGTNEEGNPTLAVDADFNDATKANTFNNELRAYVQNNSTDFTKARIRVHDCFHASNENLPCEIGDVWQL